ncbi:MAG: hypothetical protein IT434_12975 [Phycisphaerales bacterium]|jgi:hypothetical protein|nr:hypothetical protein [Phycisphaerales bacterium]
MTMNLIAICIVALLAYIWLTRGFFSALLNLMCVIAAGAIAFGVWEPLSLFFLGKAGNSGLGATLGDAAWALGLGLPFLVSLALLRAVTDALLPSNAQCGTVGDYVGGGLCGLLAGIIVAGISIMSLSFLRVAPDFMGYKGMDYSISGAIKKGDSLWVPVDKLTAGLYAFTSKRFFSTSEPLAKWYPAVHEAGHELRLNFGDGKARNTIKPEDFRVIGRYTVGGEAGQQPGALLSDVWDSTVQNVNDRLDQPVGGPARLEGFVIDFASGAKEKTGQVVIGAAQLRLLCENASEEPYLAHPIAVVTQAESSKTNFARFRYNARDLHLASVGAASKTVMAFEFLVPKDFKPVGLFVKNIRTDVSGMKATLYAGTSDRDAGVISGQLVQMQVDAPDTSSGTSTASSSGRPEKNEGVEASNSLGYVIQDGKQGRLEIEGGRIKDGRQEFAPEDLKQQHIDRNLRIDRIFTTDDVVIVKVDVSRDRPASWLGGAARAVEMVLPPQIMDTGGQVYDAVGYIYEDAGIVDIRFTPGQPIRGLSEIPYTITSSRNDQKLKLVFRISRGVTVQDFRIGSKVLQVFDPKLELKDPQR